MLHLALKINWCDDSIKYDIAKLNLVMNKD